MKGYLLSMLAGYPIIAALLTVYWLPWLPFQSYIDFLPNILISKQLLAHWYELWFDGIANIIVISHLSLFLDWLGLH